MSYLCSNCNQCHVQKETAFLLLILKKNNLYDFGEPIFFFIYMCLDSCYFLSELYELHTLAQVFRKTGTIIQVFIFVLKSYVAHVDSLFLFISFVAEFCVTCCLHPFFRVPQVPSWMKMLFQQYLNFHHLWLISQPATGNETEILYVTSKMPPNYSTV